MFLQTLQSQTPSPSMGWSCSSESWHLLQFNKFPVWELPFSTWIIDRSNLIHKGGNLISWLFNERCLVSLGSAECGWWWGRTLKWMSEHWQKTLWTYRCHISTAVACLQCGMLFLLLFFLQGRLVKSPTISFLSELTARSCLFISMLCESKYGWAEVAQSRGSAVLRKSLWHMSWVTQCWKGCLLSDPETLHVPFSNHHSLK